MKFPFVAGMERLKQEIENCRFNGQCPNGLVTATVGGDQSLVAIQIDPSLLRPDNAQLVAKCIVEAVNDAWNNCKQGLFEKVAEVFGSMPFGQAEGDSVGQQE